VNRGIEQNLALYGLLCITACSAFAAEPVVLRASVTPAEVWVGQRALLHIEVLGRDGWAQIKRLADFEVPGTYVLRTQSQGTRLQETIAGTAYTGQQYELSLYPQRGGRITIPALPVDVAVKVWGVNAQDVQHQVVIPATSFTCKVPPGAEGLQGLISTTRFTAFQTWTPEVNDVNVGDAIQRTITLQAVDVSAMAFAPLQYPPIEGLGIYPGEPTVDDVTSRGTLTGKRVETVTYVCERAGAIKIPAHMLSWWNVDVRELEHIELPGRMLQVMGNMAVSTTTATETLQPQNPLLLWVTLVAMGGAAGLLLRNRGRMTDQWHTWQQARDQTEAAYFRRAMQSLRSGFPNAALRDIMQWLDRINTDPRPAQLDRFLRDYGDAGMQEAATTLVGGLSKGTEGSDLTTFSHGLEAARKRWRRRQRQHKYAHRVLPELNA
jgi:hypothetical protein